MNKNHSKAHASSRKAGASGLGSAFGLGSGLTSSSTLSYATEPPDLNLISDANVVVIFKNLAKKDGTTKTKALDELQQYVRSPARQDGEVEDAVLQAWAKSYPRLSIDSDRRVRQLSHVLQGRLSAACGKRIATYLPKIVGSWLASLYDNDRATARGAQESLKLVFPTSEKLHSLRRIYHGSILQYCTDAILNETAQTLSDERSVSLDDAEAKYVRVIASSISLISSLLADMDTLEIVKHQSGYEEMLENKNLWKLSYHKDPSIRRSVYRLLSVCLDKVPDILSKDLQTIGACFVFKCLGTDQLGSSADYLESLIALTTSLPTVWTDHYHSKKSAWDQLRYFMSRGSQSGTVHFWYLLSRLLQEVPIIPRDLEGSMDLLRTLHNGVTSKTEPKPNLEAAWTSYLGTAEYLCDGLPAEDQTTLLQGLVLPVVKQHIKPNPFHTQWSLPVASWSGAILEKAVRLLGGVLHDAWSSMSSLLIADMKASSPEQSKAFESSQDAIAVEGERWASIQAVAMGASSDASIFLQNTAQVIEEAISLLKLRSGKPYAAASVVEAALRRGRCLQEPDKCLPEDFSAFLSDDVPDLITSATPSSGNLVRLLLLCHSVDSFQEAWSKTLKGLVQRTRAQDETFEKRLDTALEAILCSPEAPQANLAQDAELQDFLVQRFTASINTESHAAGDPLIQRLLRRRSDVLSSASIDKILMDLTDSLSISEKAPRAIKSLEMIQNSNRETISKFGATSAGSGLTSNLLILSESADEDIAIEASNLCASLITTVGSGSQPIVFNVISKGLSEALPSSVSVENLVGLALRLWNETEKDQVRIAARLIPDTSALEDALAQLFRTGPSHDLSIANLLGGAVYLTNATDPIKSSHRWDVAGSSIFLRLTLYISQLVSKTNVFDYLSQSHRRYVLRFLALAVQLINEDITLGSVRGLFAHEVETDVSESISEVQHLINGWLKASREWQPSSAEQSGSLWITETIEALFESAAGASPSAYYHALAYATLVRELVELHGRLAVIEKPIPEARLGVLRENEGM